ncbi:Leucine--tRNA ligase [Candidatus Erwinia haradaeae]|uniref:Leucine--tRNA ligase n=1 Tax=Candidatus Erwinia haradaeae TaxID=1922217 RepID=A0A451DJJ8_9GAMM|nr:leucine--tRNA ligase [Candidatus Erwinia haradaeae]VFP86870.1 Leucine--tRNA ligase [Candidatus Erwinia haradaeae]
MKEQYYPHEIEDYVQKHWDQQKTFQATTNENKEKYYCLSMIPYPSGSLHMGHVRNYTIGDVLSRYHRMLGKNVLQPIGWDAFGLPAESAALENNTPPSSWTYANISHMRNQLKSLGLSYDWNREITTCQADYYRWEQWFFIQLYKKGLVYKKTASVNWCPHHMTVLANEQVIDGCCWRCHSIVQKKDLPQWFMKITHYAEELLNSLDTLDEWPENVKTMQRNWIGRSEGLEIDFRVLDTTEIIKIYTTRPDTIMGVTYIAVAANHPITYVAAMHDPSIANFINKYLNTKVSEPDLITMEKIGILTKLVAKHPLTGESLPVWISNYVIMDYGTGAIMGVPGHSQNDWEFAQKYYIPIKSVVLPTEHSVLNLTQCAMTKKGTLFNSGQFNGLSYEKAFIMILREITQKGIGRKKIHYRLKDWCVSRQRYWGVPIPMITLEDGKIVPVPDSQLPIVLPETNLSNDITHAIKMDAEWARTIVNGQQALRETDTFDTFMESSWYYARYTSANYKHGMLDPSSADYWLPVDCYIGGIEHATMHLLYFRFFHKLLRDAGLVNSNEPVKRLLCQGMVLSDAFYFTNHQGDRRWISSSDITIKRDNNGKILNAVDIGGNQLVYAGMTKMSKSKKNGVDVTTMVNCYGADTLRLFIMFAAPLDMSLEWKITGVEGMHRFLKRVWKLVWQHAMLGIPENPKHSLYHDKQKALRRNLHTTIRKVSTDIGQRQTFNTAIAAIMTLTNKLRMAPQRTAVDRILMQEALMAIVRMLHPFAPHITFVLWKALGEKEDIDYAPWPQEDKIATIEESQLVIIQVNGKMRSKIILDKNLKQKELQELAQQDPAILKYLHGTRIKKIIYVPGKILNFVLTS